MAMMNIPNLVTIKLDGTHFILWELQLPLVRSQQLLGFLDGTTAAPEKWIECSTSTDGSVKVSKPNPAYEEWLCKDQLLVSWINSTLTQRRKLQP